MDEERPPLDETPWPADAGEAEARDAAAAEGPPRPPRSRRVTDEEILAVLLAGEEDGITAAELCETHGITLPMYCVWKRKFGGLSLDEIRDLRRGESRRRRRTIGIAAALILLVAAGAGVLTVARSSGGADTSTAMGLRAFSPSDRPYQPKPATPAPQPAGRKASEAPQAPAATAPSARAAAPAPASGEPVRSAATAPDGKPPSPAPLRLSSDDTGIVVQVAAVPDVEEAERFLARLTAAGHRAYLLSTAVGDLPLIRVRVGPFPTRQAAAAAVRQLERQGFEGAWLVR